MSLFSSAPPWVMGILNVTPDSFSDGGSFDDPQRAIDHAVRMVEAGAEMIDVGGESTRPDSQPISVEKELQRVIPVIEALTSMLDTPISVDTTKPEVMEAALNAGARMVNDITALSAKGAVECISRYPHAHVCLMHMKGAPATMQNEPHYEDVVKEVRDYLLQRAALCLEAGMPVDQIWLDPGIGFGKTDDHNFSLLAHLDQLVATGHPILVGVSRKSTIGRVLGREVGERLSGSLTLAALAAYQGAQMIRVHDVAESRDALILAERVRAARHSS